MKEIVIAQPLGITRELLESLASGLKKEGWNLTAYDKVPSGQEELGKRIEGADIAVIANYPLKKEALEKASSLKYLCVAFTGVDHVDISYCKERHIAVSNCAGYSTESVAELAFGMVLSLYRMLPECGEAIRNGKTNAGLCGIELKGRKFGIIGTGAIGQRVAGLAQAFGCEVYGYSRTPKTYLVNYTDLDTLLKTCDIISIHVPLTDETRGLINKEKIALMKKDAILINTARGPVVDSKALADALKEGKIAGAGIDVFEGEPPLPADHPLLSAPHTILSPHVGFDTKEAMERRAILVFHNIENYLKGDQKNVIC